MDGPALAAVLCAGASAGADRHRAHALARGRRRPRPSARCSPSPAPTRVTRAFSGRTGAGDRQPLPGRARRRRAGRATPRSTTLTGPLRAAARKRGDADAFNLWAGQAHELVQARPAGEIVREMAAEARAVLDRVSAARRGPGTSAGPY